MSSYDAPDWWKYHPEINQFHLFDGGLYISADIAARIMGSDTESMQRWVRQIDSLRRNGELYVPVESLAGKVNPIAPSGESLSFLRETLVGFAKTGAPPVGKPKRKKRSRK